MERVSGLVPECIQSQLEKRSVNEAYVIHHSKQLTMEEMAYDTLSAMYPNFEKVSRTIRCNKQIVQMPVPDSQQICDDAIPS